MQVKMMKIMVIIMTMMITIQRTKVNQKELDIESNDDFEGDASANAAGARFNQHCFARWRLRRLPGIANHRRPGVLLFSYAQENYGKSKVFFF